MTLLLLIVGIVLWAVTNGVAATVGEVLTIIGAVLVALQLIFLGIGLAIAVRTGRSFNQRFF
jgi:hypothetical protein